MWVESVPFSFLFGGKKRKEFSLGYLETNQTTKQNTSVGSKWHSQKQGAGGAERSRPAPAWVVPDTASEEVPLLQTQKGLNCFRVISLAWRGQGLRGRASHRGGGTVCLGCSARRGGHPNSKAHLSQRGGDWEAAGHRAHQGIWPHPSPGHLAGGRAAFTSTLGDRRPGSLRANSCACWRASTRSGPAHLKFITEMSSQALPRE